MGDDPEIWLTYNEAAKRLGIKPDSVRRRAAARKWPRRQGNDGLARVRIPTDVIRTVSPDATPALTPDVTPDASGAIREELAEAKATIAGLEARLKDAHNDRDAWRERAQKLDDRLAEALKPRPGFFDRLLGR